MFFVCPLLSLLSTGSTKEDVLTNRGSTNSNSMRGLPSILSLFRNELNKFNNARAQILDSIYDMT